MFLVWKPLSSGGGSDWRGILFGKLLRVRASQTFFGALSNDEDAVSTTCSQHDSKEDRMRDNGETSSPYCGCSYRPCAAGWES